MEMMNYISIVTKDGMKAENHMKSFEILERFLKVELPNGTFSFINIDDIKTFHVSNKKD